nr:uncharacterized protein LOC129281575 [Lytechinus pictus]
MVDDKWCHGHVADDGDVIRGGDDEGDCGADDDDVMMSTKTNGMSEGAIVGLAVGGVVIVLVVVVLSLCTLAARRQMMYHRRMAATSPISKLGMMPEAGPAVIPWQDKDTYAGSKHRSDMEMGSVEKPGDDEGPYFSGVYDNHGFNRVYMATGKSGSTRGQYYHD